MPLLKKLGKQKYIFVERYTHDNTLVQLYQFKIISTCNLWQEMARNCSFEMVFQLKNKENHIFFHQIAGRCEFFCLIYLLERY